MVDIFSSDDYRKTLKQKLKDLQLRKPALTWRSIAAQIPMQYTYLSRALNNEQTHLSEDHLFTTCRALEFFPNEIEFILLQRAYAVSQDEIRKEHLFKRLQQIRSEKKLNSETKELDSSSVLDEMNFLFEPYCVVVQVALAVPEFKKDPRKLCQPLGLSIARLREILRVLARAGFIELDEDGLTIKKSTNPRLHFGRGHALMRFHQALLKNQVQSKLMTMPEEQKDSKIFTFTMDDDGFEKVKDEFQNFIKRVEKIAKDARHKSVFQLNFDLFKWF